MPATMRFITAVNKVKAWHKIPTFCQGSPLYKEAMCVMKGGSPGKCFKKSSLTKSFKCPKQTSASKKRSAARKQRSASKQKRSASKKLSGGASSPRARSPTRRAKRASVVKRQALGPTMYGRARSSATRSAGRRRKLAGGSEQLDELLNSMNN